MAASALFLLLFGVPLYLCCLIGYGVFRYVKARRKKKTAPEPSLDEELKRWRWVIILAAVVLALFAAFLVGVTVLVMSAVVYM